MKWRTAGTGRFYDPDEITVVYFDTDSGDTHLLGDFAAFVIAQFDGQSLTVEELAERISPAIEPGQFPDLAGAVHDVVLELSALDILKHD